MARTRRRKQADKAEKAAKQQQHKTPTKARPGRAETVTYAAPISKAKVPTPKRTLIGDIFTSRPLPEYAKPGIRKVRFAEPTQHQTSAKYEPSKVIKTEAKKNNTRHEHDARSSFLTRDKKPDVCKKRPEGHHPKRAGGSASKKFVPWCK